MAALMLFARGFVASFVLVYSYEERRPRQSLISLARPLVHRF
jgi:hypothetical protein